MIQWKDLFWRLMHNHTRMRSWEIMQSTMPELVLAIDDDIEKARVPGGGSAMTPKEIEAHAKRLRELTPRERLELIKAGRL